jgi:hypothetical protein
MTSTTGNALRKKTGIGDILMRLGPLMVLTILFIVFSIALPDKFLRVSQPQRNRAQTALYGIRTQGSS